MINTADVINHDFVAVLIFFQLLEFVRTMGFRVFVVIAVSLVTHCDLPLLLPALLLIILLTAAFLLLWLLLLAAVGLLRRTVVANSFGIIFFLSLWVFLALVIHVPLVPRADFLSFGAPLLG